MSNAFYMKRAFSSLLVLLAYFPSFSQNAEIDSLLLMLKTASVDSMVIKIRNDLSRQFLNISEYDKAIRYNNDALHLAGQVLSVPDISKQYRNSILKAQSDSYNNLGNACYYKGDHDKSIENHLKALKIRETIGDKRGISASYNNMGTVMYQKGDMDKAMELFLKSSQLAEEINEKSLMSTAYNNIGLAYQGKNNPDKAVVFFQKGLKLREEIGDKQAIASSYNNIGSIYSAKNDYEKAEEYYFKSLKIMENMGDKMFMSVAYNNIGDLYLNQHKTVDAKKMQLIALALGKEMKSKPTIAYSYFALARCDSAMGDFKEAYEHQKSYGIMNDSIFDEESDKRMLDMQTKYDTEKKEHEIELLTKDGELQKTQMRIQKIVIGSVIAGLLLVIFFAVLIFNRLQVTRKQKVIIEEQKILVDIKNKHITDSINYAKRIQDAILPSSEDFKNCFPGHFLFFRPKDIVSGDFYWLSDLTPPHPLPLSQGRGEQSTQTEGSSSPGKALLVVADCTGHGVPGAFMSMIGHTLLNEIVNEQHIIQPADILNHLNEGIIQALHQESRTQDDGMDISVCLFDKAERKIIFAGANHSIYITEGDSVREVKGDIYSIGSMFGSKDGPGNNAPFTQKEICLQKGATVFLSTDGFPDQIGGEKGKKFLVRQFENLLQRVSVLEIKEQEQQIIQAFDKWKGKYNQLDDILLAGIKPWP